MEPFLLLEKKEFIMNLWKNKTTTVTSAFSMLAEDMPIDLSLNVFNKLIQLGYSLDQQPYNAIISKLTSNEEINMIKDNEKDEIFIKENLIIFKKYKVKEKLGKGAFGDVYMGSCIENNELVAIKEEGKRKKKGKTTF